MRKAVRISVLVLFSLAMVSSVFITGCTRYANEEQLTTLDETGVAAESAEARVAELEKEKAELQAKLDAMKAELEMVKKEMEKIKSRL
jgi:peptidoglycan hydrolase CwlO-like protein